MMTDAHKPAWQRINELFERFGLPHPPTRLRDELVMFNAGADEARVIALTGEVERLRKREREHLAVIKSVANGMQTPDPLVYCHDYLKRLAALTPENPTPTPTTETVEGQGQ